MHEKHVFPDYGRCGSIMAYSRKDAMACYDRSQGVSVSCIALRYSAIMTVYRTVWGADRNLMLQISKTTYQLIWLPYECANISNQVKIHVDAHDFSACVCMYMQSNIKWVIIHVAWHPWFIWMWSCWNDVNCAWVLWSPDRAQSQINNGQDQSVSVDL